MGSRILVAEHHQSGHTEQIAGPLEFVPAAAADGFAALQGDPRFAGLPGGRGHQHDSDSAVDQVMNGCAGEDRFIVGMGMDDDSSCYGHREILEV
jgi:hypothetical protein